mgnify:CR=1 FL=1
MVFTATEDILNASTIHQEALMFLNITHGLETQTLEGQHRCIVFADDQNIVDR